MILQALNRYYEILLNDPTSGIAPPGYSQASVSFALNLSPQGELLGIFPLFESVQRGKKTFEAPRHMLVPEQMVHSSNIRANFLSGNHDYVLGLAAPDEKHPEKVPLRFEAFRKFNKELLEKADCPEARAVLAFLDQYDPGQGMAHPVIEPHLERLWEGGNIVFKLDGHSGFVHEAAKVRQAWNDWKAASSGEYLSQCLVTGRRAPIERVHPKIQGVKDAKSTGASLVSFNERAYESYNRTEGQGLNSPVSQQAAFAYTTALNYLLSRENKNPKFTIGDTTAVYWAEGEDKGQAALFSSLFGVGYAGGDSEGEAGAAGRDQQAERRLGEIAEKVRKAQALDTDRLLEGLDADTRFYVLGLAPNAARIAVRFFHTDPFRRIIERIMAHYADLCIVKEFDNQPDLIPIGRILDETVSKKTSDKPQPLMAGAVMRAILEDTPYPAALYYQIINRLRADMDDKEKGIYKITYVRAAVIKAFLTRKYRNQPNHPIQEVLCMSLNEQSTIPAYLLGRLFAVLEKAQQEANPDLNATIKDRYFTSACAAPATVFPVLLRLSQHHISKAEYGKASDRRIQDIMGLLDVEKDPFPAHLSLDQQGIFVLGYYHQRADFYKPKNHNQTMDETQDQGA